jgi:hypothetical protein
MKFIKTQVVCNEQENDNTSCDTNGKPENIDERIIFVTQKIPEREDKIVSDHVLTALFFTTGIPKTVPMLYHIDFQTIRH